MLKVFDEFREKLDHVMLKAFGKRVLLWGYQIQENDVLKN